MLLPLQTDAADGSVDWKNEATGVFKDAKVIFKTHQDTSHCDQSQCMPSAERRLIFYLYVICYKTDGLFGKSHNEIVILAARFQWLRAADATHQLSLLPILVIPWSC